MKAVVTGICGFAGGHLAEHLRQAGDEVLGIVSGRPGAAPSVHSPETVPLVWNLADTGPAPPQVVERLNAFAPDCIYHLAAASLPGECGDSEPTANCLATNVAGTRRVVEWAQTLASRPRFVFVSTSRVYAPVDASRPHVDEESPTGPLHGYGRSKLLAEAVVREGVQSGGLDAVIVRAFQHTGPRQDGRLMLPEWSRQLANGSPVLQVRQLEAWIDCSDVRDVVRAYRLLAISGSAAGVYNVGSGVSRRAGDVVDALCRIAACRPQVVGQASGRKQDPIARIDRLVAATGWQPEIPWEQTLRDTLEDWRRRVATGTNSHSSLETSA